MDERRLSPMRQSIADRLGESYRSAVHVTASRDVPAGPLLETANQREQIGLLDVLLRVVSSTLSTHPEFNARFADDIHSTYEEHNIGIAVDVDAGLLAPVLAAVESKSLEEIATERERLVGRVTTGEHTMSDLQHGTFTVSNLGPLGIDAFTPVINPPQIAILGVSRIRERVIPENGAYTVRPEIRFDLSFDHRVVDGADAARFLATLAEEIDGLA